MEKISYPLKEAISASGISRSEIYRLLSAGKLSAVKSGRTTLILADSLRDYVASLPSATFRPPATPAT